MNECLMTPQHEKQIGYWVSEKGNGYEASHLVLGNVTMFTWSVNVTPTSTVLSV